MATFLYTYAIHYYMNPFRRNERRAPPFLSLSLCLSLSLSLSLSVKERRSTMNSYM